MPLKLTKSAGRFLCALTLILPWQDVGAEEIPDDVDVYVKGQADPMKVKLSFEWDGSSWQVDWKHSQIHGKLTTSLAAGKEARPLEAKILGPAQVSVLNLDQTEVNSPFVLLAVGETYCVHPTLYKKGKLQHLAKTADLDRACGQKEILISPVAGHPEVIRASGAVLQFIHVDQSNSARPQITSIDPSAMFLPGLTWTVERPMQLRVWKGGDYGNIPLEPGKYRLDEDRIPKPLK